MRWTCEYWLNVLHASMGLSRGHLKRIVNHQNIKKQRKQSSLKEVLFLELSSFNLMQPARCLKLLKSGVCACWRHQQLTFSDLPGQRIAPTTGRPATADPATASAFSLGVKRKTMATDWRCVTRPTVQRLAAHATPNLHSTATVQLLGTPLGLLAHWGVIVCFPG